MALTETTKVDQIEITENNHIQVRIATIIEKDGTELNRDRLFFISDKGTIGQSKIMKIIHYLYEYLKITLIINLVKLCQI